MNFLNLVQGAAGKVKGVATLLSGLTKTQAIIAGVATVTAVGGVGTGGYFLYDHFHQPEPIVADVVISTEVAEEPTEEVVAVEEVVTEETEAAEPETVTLVGSSIEKDLKIKIQDESSKNVKGQPFEITIKADKKKAKSTTYSDDDKDGIIYIKSIDAGKYDVSLNEIDGYISKENSYKVTVKDKIEYTKVDVKDEIKSAAEVAPAEDAEVDNVEVEAVIQDTVETVDSTCTPSKVGAGDVDTSNFPTASVGGSTKERGQEVTLYEAGSKLGGNMRLAAYPPGKGDITNMIRSYIHRCQKDGVEIKLNHEVTADFIKGENPDSVIIATGSKTLVLPIEGIDNPSIIYGSDLLEGKRAAGKKVLVVGGGMVGCETAAFLGEQNHDVTVIEFRDTVGADVIHEHRVYLMKVFEEYGIGQITGAKVCRFFEDGVEYETADGEHHEARGYDSVVLSMGYRNYNSLEEQVKAIVPDTYVIGDRIRARRALDATKEAYDVASQI